MVMIKIVLCTLLIMLSVGAFSQEITTVILVRHAEKAFDEGGDPELTEEGKQRSDELARVLSEVEVDKIFSTDFKRTKQTVMPLAKANDKEIELYNPFELDEIVSLIEKYKGKTLVFSGHSNTTPVILNKLVGEDRYRQLNDADYDNLYIVSYIKPGKAKVISLEFGADSEM